MSRALARLARLRGLEARAAERDARAAIDRAARAHALVARLDALLAPAPTAQPVSAQRAGAAIATDARQRAALAAARDRAAVAVSVAERQSIDAERVRRLTHACHDAVEAGRARRRAEAEAGIQARVLEQVPTLARGLLGSGNALAGGRDR